MSTKNHNQKTNKMIQKRGDDDAIKKKKNMQRKKKKHTHKKTYTNMKNETHENYAQLRMPPKKMQCMFIF